MLTSLSMTVDFIFVHLMKVDSNAWFMYQWITLKSSVYIKSTDLCYEL